MLNKFRCLHPDPSKQGVNIDAEKYHALKNAILAVIEESGEIRFSELPKKVKKLLPHFQGSLEWYLVSVKLDLEARGLIERKPKTAPQV